MISNILYWRKRKSYRFYNSIAYSICSLYASIYNMTLSDVEVVLISIKQWLLVKSNLFWFLILLKQETKQHQRGQN